MKDYYSVLNIDRNASEKEIKKAYRTLAKKFHPDKNIDDDSAKIKFQEIQEAYGVLSNKDKKANYDRTGSVSGPIDDVWEDMIRRAQRTSGWGSRTMYSDTYADIFDDIFGSHWNGKGKNVKVNVHITLKEAFSGTKRTINLSGDIFEFDIGKGLRDGKVLVFKGKGGKGTVQNGDLYVKVYIQEHDKFVRVRNDLKCWLTIDLYTAVLGGPAYITTFDGKVKIKIPKGTQYGKEMRIPGKGMPVYENEMRRGDLYFRIMISLPKKISEKEKELFVKLQKMVGK